MSEFLESHIQQTLQGDSSNKSKEADMFTFTPPQLLLLSNYILPEDKNKYAVEMASFLFTPDELDNTTAANLDSVKIAFISSKYGMPVIDYNSFTSKSINFVCFL